MQMGYLWRLMGIVQYADEKRTIGRITDDTHTALDTPVQLSQTASKSHPLHPYHLSHLKHPIQRR